MKAWKLKSRNHVGRILVCEFKNPSIYVSIVHIQFDVGKRAF